MIHVSVRVRTRYLGQMYNTGKEGNKERKINTTANKKIGKQKETKEQKEVTEKNGSYKQQNINMR